MQDEPRQSDADDLSLLKQTQVIRGQIETLRALLVEAQQNGLGADEKTAVAELARAAAELTDAVRELLH